MLEVIFALGIFLLIMGSVSAFFLNSLRSSNVLFEQLANQSQGRRLLNSFINEVRSAVYSSDGAYPIAVASTTEFIFFSKLNPQLQSQRIRYFLEGTEIKKGVIKPGGNPPNYTSSTEEVVTAVDNVYSTGTPIFYYYDQSYTGASTSLIQPVDVTKIRMAEIIFQLEKNPLASPSSLNLRAKAEIRNLKTN